MAQLAIFGEDRVQAQLPSRWLSTNKSTLFRSPIWQPGRAGTISGTVTRAGDELVLVVEVADTSLRYDVTGKRDLYARAGVPEYWVLNIKGRKLIVHRNPKQGKYAVVSTLTLTRHGIDRRPVNQRRR